MSLWLTFRPDGIVQLDILQKHKTWLLAWKDEAILFSKSVALERDRLMK
ncbi:hypothetical protein [Altericista sp. CCNU0014]